MQYRWDTLESIAVVGGETMKYFHETIVLKDADLQFRTTGYILTRPPLSMSLTAFTTRTVVYRKKGAADAEEKRVKFQNLLYFTVAMTK